MGINERLQGGNQQSLTRRSFFFFDFFNQQKHHYCLFFPFNKLLFAGEISIQKTLVFFFLIHHKMHTILCKSLRGLGTSSSCNEGGLSARQNNVALPYIFFALRNIHERTPLSFHTHGAKNGKT